MAEGKDSSEATSQLHRKYHSYKQIKLMNMTKEEAAAQFKKKEAP